MNLVSLFFKGTMEIIMSKEDSEVGVLEVITSIMDDCKKKGKSEIHAIAYKSVHAGSEINQLSEGLKDYRKERLRAAELLGTNYGSSNWEKHRIKKDAEKASDILRRSKASRLIENSKKAGHTDEQVAEIKKISGVASFIKRRGPFRTPDGILFQDTEVAIKPKAKEKLGRRDGNQVVSAVHSSIEKSWSRGSDPFIKKYAKTKSDWLSGYTLALTLEERNLRSEEDMREELSIHEQEIAAKSKQFLKLLEDRIRVPLERRAKLEQLLADKEIANEKNETVSESLSIFNRVSKWISGLFSKMLGRK